MRLIGALIIIVLVLGSLFASPLNKYFSIFINHTTFAFGLNLNNIASDNYVNWVNSQSTNTSTIEGAIFLNEPVFQNIKKIAYQSILGETSVDESKWIEVDLSEQRLYMKENGNTVNSFLVSTGKWYPTPTGSYRIWTKLTSTRMQGGSKKLGTYYNLPNVPHTMYYYKGYGIHGAYWHNNFGNPMSHGCVNMKPEEAQIVFNWAQVGTRVTVMN